MNDDLGVPAALAALHELVTEGNRQLSAGASDEQTQTTLNRVRAMLDILGVDPLASPWRERAAGGSDEQVLAMRGIGQHPMPRGLFSALEEDAIELTIQMTKSVQVEADLIKRLRDELGLQALVELVGVIAAYNMVSRFLVALKVTPENTN